MRKAWNQADDFECVETIDLEPCEALDRVRFLEPDNLIPIEQVKDEKGRLCWQTMPFNELQKQFVRNRKYRHRARRELRRLNKKIAVLQENRKLGTQLNNLQRDQIRMLRECDSGLFVTGLRDQIYTPKRWWEFWK